jgi:hypothetical protein
MWNETGARRSNTHNKVTLARGGSPGLLQQFKERFRLADEQSHGRQVAPGQPVPAPPREQIQRLESCRDTQTSELGYLLKEGSHGCFYRT